MSRRRTVLLAAAVSLSLGLSVLDTGTAGAAPSAPVSQATYTVKSGDFLFGIASKLGVKTADLLQVNNLTLTSLIYPGMVLKVPAGGTVPASPAASVSPTTGSYVIKSGDHLTGIAAKHNMKLTELLSLNNFTVTSVLLPGKTIKVNSTASLPTTNSVPATAPKPTSATNTYTVRPGDFLSGIAARHGMTLSGLLSLNGITATTLIHPGSTLQVTGAVQTSASSNNQTQGASKVDAVIAYAKAQLGKPWKFFAKGPDAFDCSGLVKAAFATVGINLPHQSLMQSAHGTPVDISQIRAGDLVFTYSGTNQGFISHVGIALSPTTWIHSPALGDVVKIGSIPTWRVVKVQRIIAD